MTLNQVHQERKLLSPNPKLDEEDELDVRARELGLDKIDSDNLKSLNQNLLHLRATVVSKIQKVKLRN